MCITAILEIRTGKTNMNNVHPNHGILNTLESDVLNSLESAMIPIRSW